VNNIPAVIINNGTEVIPSPSNDFKVGKIRLPHLMHKLGFSILERATFNDQREVKFLAGWRSTLAAYRFTADRSAPSRPRA
jgi:hypothetical protein